LRAQGTLGTCLSGLLFVGLAATGCTTETKTSSATHSSTKSIQPAKVTYNYTAKDRDCLKRAMYFESEHSDNDGYMAVGTVVMNRLTSGAYPNSICGVVAQERQFAPGVMTRLVRPEAEAELDTAATAILRGERHRGVKDAMFFHTDGLKFPYNNMHYVVVAGGNAFYEKRGRDGELQTPAPLPGYEVAMNYVSARTATTTQFPIALAAVDSLPGVMQTQVSTQITAPTPIPAQIPIPTPAPVADTAATMSSAPIATVAVPSPRPAFDGASPLSYQAKVGG
jgi:spore germination cell wall hydrolase CwlJ-like protein